MIRQLLRLPFLILAAPVMFALPHLTTLPPMLSEQAPAAGAFVLFDADGTAPVVTDPADHPGVLRAVSDLRADLASVGAPSAERSARRPILVGTLGRSQVIDALVASGKLEVSDLAGKWESFAIVTLDRPTPDLEQALVVVGSDKRGTIYGLYELSEQLGVSPWHWWADVPPRRRAAAHAAPGRHFSGEPVVKYRGIFLNDEAPALTNWTYAKHGGYNRDFYTKVFTLMLRLRANYLWPAMWNNQFNVDDPENPRLADEYGIVMGTSHHEPMMRAHQEWTRNRRSYGNGKWDYASNGEALARFFAEGIRRNHAYENLVTIGMRGDGDEPMSEEANVALLERIVKDQREIIARETGRPAEETPQIWALYKEVQEYFEKGMRVPDDVTLLWCDDNWGNIRRLPTPDERKRKGGAGVYYHFDYVGGPRSYKWLNTYPLEKVWEQMHLAWRHEANRIWIVNVGDLKPMEFPIEFFLRYAWNPARWPANSTDDFLRAMAARDFGPEHADEIAALAAGYTRLNGLRKPEQLAPDLFSLVHERESERIIGAWRDLLARARALDARLPAEHRAAFFQLVLHPIESCAVVNELYRAAGLNALHAVQGRASANTHAQRARDFFAADAEMTRRWDALLDGKWKHLMDQVRLGYTNWEQPNLSVMPAVAEVLPRARGELAIAVEGDPAARPGGYGLPAVARLPALHRWAAGDQATRWIDVFNRGAEPVRFKVRAREPWLRVEPATGEVTATADVRLEVGADWAAIPAGETTGRLEIVALDAAGRETRAALRVDVPVIQPDAMTASGASGAFVELERRLAVEAPNYSRASAPAGETWQVLARHGRTLGGVTYFPVTRDSVEQPGGDSPHLEYALWTQSAGQARLRLVVSPTQAYVPGRGLRVAVSLGDETPRIVDLLADRSEAAWDRMVSDGVNQITTPLSVPAAGRHALKIWLVDPGVVLQRLVVDFGGVKPTYLGPRESPQAP